MDKGIAEKCELQAQISELKEDQKNCWAKEREKVYDSGIKKGFDYFLTRFFANDPDYDFSSFNVETLSYINDFKKDNFAAVSSRRIALGLDHRHVQASDLTEVAEDMAVFVALDSIAAEDRVISLEGVPKQEARISPFPDYLLSTPGYRGAPVGPSLLEFCQ